MWSAIIFPKIILILCYAKTAAVSKIVNCNACILFLKVNLFHCFNYWVSITLDLLIYFIDLHFNLTLSPSLCQNLSKKILTPRTCHRLITWLGIMSMLIWLAFLDQQNDHKWHKHENRIWFNCLLYYATYLCTKT